MSNCQMRLLYGCSVVPVLDRVEREVAHLEHHVREEHELEREVRIFDGHS